MATISSQLPSKPLILDLDENQINQLLIIRKKTPYDEEEDEMRLKARKMFDFLGIDFLEVEEFGDELADSIEGIWNTQLSDTAGYLGELLHDMIDQLNLALMALFKDELDRQNAEFFRVRQTGLDPNTGIFYDEEGDNHLLSREHKPTDDFFQLRLNMDQSYVINMAQGGWYYYDYRLGVGNSNSIDINQSNY
jgi:hypothetical protein